MRVPWSKSRNSAANDSGTVSKSQAALSGPEGDGQVHDLEYWVASGFLTLPKDPLVLAPTAAPKVEAAAAPVGEPTAAPIEPTAVPVGHATAAPEPEATPAPSLEPQPAGRPSPR